MKYCGLICIVIFLMISTNAEALSPKSNSKSCLLTFRIVEIIKEKEIMVRAMNPGNMKTEEYETSEVEVKADITKSKPMQMGGSTGIYCGDLKNKTKVIKIIGWENPKKMYVGSKSQISCNFSYKEELSADKLTMCGNFRARIVE